MLLLGLGVISDFMIHALRMQTNPNVLEKDEPRGQPSSIRKTHGWWVRQDLNRNFSRTLQRLEEHLDRVQQG